MGTTLHLQLHGNRWSIWLFTAVSQYNTVLGTGPLLNGAGLLQEVERACAKELSSCSLPFMKKDPETLF